MQENPNLLRNTNATALAKAIELSTDISFFNAHVTLCKMVNSQMVNRFGTQKRANFYINYYHKDIPGYVLDEAPKEERQRVEIIKKGVKKNQHIDEVGCVVTEAPKEEKKEEITITANEETKQDNVEEPKEETKEVSSDASEENTTSVPVEIKDTERGLSISINLNININK